MKISQNQMSELKHAVETAALRNYRSNRYQFFFFNKMIQALGIRPTRDILKQAHIMIKEGKSVEEIRELIFDDCEIPEETSQLKFNKVQHRLIKHIAHTFRRLLRQRDEGWVDSFLMMEANAYAYAMIGGPAPGAGDTDTLIRMLKDGSTDEEIMKWYIGDFTIEDDAT